MKRGRPRRGFQETALELPAEELEAIRVHYSAEFGLQRRDNWAEEFRRRCELSLYVFCKYCLNMPDMVGRLHGRVCDWLQDMDGGREHMLTPHLSVKGGRWKLLMLPVVHLKTSIGSHGFPLHALIQPKGSNIYFPGMPGADTRILLHGETEAKARENLSFISQHLQFNRVLRWLWRDIIYEHRKDSPLWTDAALVVRRSGERILAEPSITAIGVSTGLEQRHYDIIVMDDLATFDAAQSELVMGRARARRKACRSRLNDLVTSIELGIGTHWTSQDIYTDWRRDPDVQVCIRAAIEDGEAIWPERHPLEKLLALQAEEGMGKVLFSANYMNNPLGDSFSALDWQEVRLFYVDEQMMEIVFEPVPVDDELDKAVDIHEAANRFAALGKEPVRGMTIAQFYKHLHPEPAVSAWEQHQRRLARMQRQMDITEEGSRDWVRLEELRLRKEREFGQ